MQNNKNNTLENLGLRIFLCNIDSEEISKERGFVILFVKSCFP